MGGMTLITREQVEDFNYGMALLATGGGGQIQQGKEQLLGEIDAGRTISAVDIGDLSPDAWTVTTARLGWLTHPGLPTPDPTPADLEHFGLTRDVHGNDGAAPRANRQVAAIRALEEYAAVKVEAIIPLELGAGNCGGMILTARRLGIHTVDGDYTGRAIPELGNMKADAVGSSAAPCAYVDRWDNVTIATKVVSPHMADRIGRTLCAASFGRVGFAGYLMKASDAKRAMVPNTLSLSLKTGQAIRRLRGQPPERLAAELNGWLLFKGVLRRTEFDFSHGAFHQSYGTHYLEGEEEYAGHKLRIWFKNEHHIVWLDDKVIATSPDLIMATERPTGLPVTNEEIREGISLVVFAAKTLDLEYRTPAGLRALGPGTFGFDIEYVPVEDRLRQPVGTAVASSAR